MGIEDAVNRRLTQTAVYWGNPQNDGRNRTTYDLPVEIKCRWQDKVQVMGKMDGVDVISRALVFVSQDVKENGLLWLGTLNDLDSTMEADPITIDHICIIKRFEKSPAMGSTTEFVRRAFLTPWLS